MNESTDPLIQPAAPVGPWGAGATLGFGVLIFGVFLVAQGIAALVYIGILSIQSFEEPNLPALETNGDLLALATCASALAGPLAIVLVVLLRRGPSVASYLALERVSVRTLLLWLGIAAVFVAFSDALTLALGRQIVPQVMVDVYASAAVKPLLWLALVVGAPLFEEIFFRGFLHRGFEGSALGPAGTIVVTAVVWASIHLQYDAYEIATILVLGLVLGAARHLTGSLYVPLAMHAVLNLIATVETALIAAPS